MFELNVSNPICSQAVILKAVKTMHRYVVLIIFTVTTIRLFCISTVAWAVGDGHAPWVGESLAGISCTGSNPMNYGPYDYITRKDKLAVVENAHFNQSVQQLVAGINAAGPTTDIDYTLRVIPNHHGALNSAMQFEILEERNLRAVEIQKGKTGYKLRSPVECYMQRAVNYSPLDGTSHMLYAVFLHRKGQLEEAEKRYQIALKVSPGVPNIEYNYGLLLVDLGKYAQAREIAQRLYTTKFPLKGLKKKLVSQDEWDSD